MSGLHRSNVVRALALALAWAAAPRPAAAAPCCMSATSFGVGRLKIWEDWAVGLRLGHARSLGQWDQDGTMRWNPDGYSAGLTTIEPWAILRLHERVELQARVPFLLEDRESGSTSQVAGGAGDATLAARLDVVSIGQYAGLPSLALTVSGVAPTGRRVEETSPPLFAGTTGRGAWAAALAVESEYARLPWFVRVDAGATFAFPFRRADTGETQRYGPSLQVALSIGRELVPNALVAALALAAEWEGAIRISGEPVPNSQARSLSFAASFSWTVDPSWTLVATFTNGAWPFDVGMNRDVRAGFTLGIRHGHF